MPKKRHPLLLELTTRCRQCSHCLSAKRQLWSARAAIEVGAWPRTWFATLTAGPGEHQIYLERARAATALQGIDFETLSDEEQYRLRWAQMQTEITRWLKRVRKNTHAPLRYLLVSEAHKSGLPHAHLLVHELDSERPIRHSILTAAWRDGFSKFKLVEAEAQARYLCKYLAKSAQARVRASRGYGLTDIDLMSKVNKTVKTPRPQPILNTVPGTAGVYGALNK